MFTVPFNTILMFAPDLHVEWIRPILIRLAMNPLAKALAALLPFFLLFRLRKTMNSH